MSAVGGEGTREARRHDRPRGRSQRRSCARRESRDRERHIRSGQGHRTGADHHSRRRPCAAARRAGSRQDQAGRHNGNRARPRCTAYPVHARFDAVRHPRHRSARGKPDRQAQLPLPAGSGVRPASDGRRDQPRQPAYAIGAAAGDAGTARDRRRHASRSAKAVSCPRHAKPARTGRHLSAAGSPARPLPDGNRRRLSRPQSRAKNSVRNHRCRGNARESSDERRGSDDRAASGAAAAGRRIRRRSDSCAGALGAAGTGRRRRAPS